MFVTDLMKMFRVEDLSIRREEKITSTAQSQIEFPRLVPRTGGSNSELACNRILGKISYFLIHLTGTTPDKRVGLWRCPMMQRQCLLFAGWSIGVRHAEVHPDYVIHGQHKTKRGHPDEVVRLDAETKEPPGILVRACFVSESA